MTNYNDWERKAKELVKNVEKEDEEEKRASDAALGIDGKPVGPPVAEAEKELGEFGEHTEKRKEFIDWSKQREVSFTHSPQEEHIVINTAEVNNRAVIIRQSQGCSYVFPEGCGVVKIVLDGCKNVRVLVEVQLVTSTIDIVRCEEVDIELHHPLGTIQADEITKPVRVHFAECDHVGSIYHQNAPGLAISWACGQPHCPGMARAAQFWTKMDSKSGDLITAAVVRGEADYPLDFSVGCATGQEPCAEPETLLEQRKKKAAEEREKGNEMFRANDFLQACAAYSQCLLLDPDASAIWANRSLCWLKLGDHEKALSDAVKCTEVEPTNAKGWFRKGIALHAMQRYPEAIPALVEAEKLEPKSKQIVDAIKMAQLMARKQAAGS